MSRQSSSATAAPTLRAERVPINSVSPDPANVRKHSERNILAIEASLRRFGQQTPIVIDAGGVIRKGNGTWAAAMRLGWAEIDVIRSPLHGPEAVAYAIADNRTSDLSWFDDKKLDAALRAIEAADHSLVESAGYSDEEYATIIGALHRQPEAALPVPEASGKSIGGPLQPEASVDEDGEAGPFRRVWIHFKTAEAIQEFGRLIGQPITNKTRAAWYPPEATP